MWHEDTGVIDRHTLFCVLSCVLPLSEQYTLIWSTHKWVYLHMRDKYRLQITDIFVGLSQFPIHSAFIMFNFHMMYSELGICLTSTSVGPFFRLTTNHTPPKECISFACTPKSLLLYDLVNGRCWSFVHYWIGLCLRNNLRIYVQIYNFHCQQVFVIRRRASLTSRRVGQILFCRIFESGPQYYHNNKLDE